MATRQTASDDTRALEVWLWGLAAMVALTAIIGAATRLTGSGLSITEWKPILGVIPPFGEVEWQAVFAKYKTIPQYTELNRGMSLAEFKAIYWWEWSHRLIARAIGVVFLVPFLAFVTLGRIPRGLLARLLILFALGGLQGAIGWVMVQSGLVDRISVSPYRLALHLGCAVLIFALIMWTIYDLRARRRPAAIDLATLTRGQVWGAGLLVGLLYLQVLAGALVAGHKAGLTYNTWPLMDGRLIPNGLLTMQPWWLNLFENITTVQFDHRMLAYAITVLALWQAVAIHRSADDANLRRSSAWLAVAVVAQVALGVWTLLAWVPLPLGVAHQAGALATLAVALWHLHAVRAARVD